MADCSIFKVGNNVFHNNGYIMSQVCNAFIFTIDTTKAGSASDTFVLSLNSSYSYNYNINWGDGYLEYGITSNADKTHVYDTSGTYTISITGTFPAIYFNNDGDREKVITIDSFGNIAWASLEGSYFGCLNLTSVTIGANANTSAVESIRDCFRNCISVTSIEGCEYMDVSNVNDFVAAFRNTYALIDPPNVSNWDMTNASVINSMFNTSGITSAPDMSLWNTPNLIGINNLFNSCTNMATAPDVSGLNTANISSFLNIFYGCPCDPDVSMWNISSLDDATNMFAGSNFSQENYDKLFVAWGQQSYLNNVPFHAGSATYSAGLPSDYRRDLTDAGWIITDGAMEASVKVWYDIADYSTITEALGDTSVVADKSLSGFDLTQGVGSLQPTYDATGLNGMPCITTDGSKWIKKINPSSLLANVSGATILYVAEVVDHGNAGVIGGVYTPASGSARLIAHTNDGDLGLGGRRLDTDDFQFVPAGDITDYDDHPIIGGCLADYANSNAYVYVDCDLEATETSFQTDGNTSNTTPYGISLFSNLAGTSRSPSGVKISEMLIFDEYLSTERRQIYEGYLAHKWGLADYLDAGHPYKTTEPWS